MRIRVPHLAAAMMFVATPALADIQINVDKAAQTLTVSRDGKVLHTWPVSTGRTGRFTPAGDFRAFRMEKDHYSREFDDAPMPYSIFFTQRGHAIHGSFETKKLGRPASGGCVRLAPENAKLLFEMVKAEGVLKTKVTVSGDERVAIARANRELAQGGANRPGTGLPPQYIPEHDAPPRERYAAPAPQYQQPQYREQPAQQQYYYDGYRWQPYNGAQSYRAAPQPYYQQRGYAAPPYYYQRGYGYTYD
jgi:hypothetical protein